MKNRGPNLDELLPLICRLPGPEQSCGALSGRVVGAGGRLCVATLLLWAAAAPGATKVVIGHNDPGKATPAFTFRSVPAPSKNDAGTQAEFVLVDGQRGINSGPLENLHDGKLPGEEDAPDQNFYFLAGTDGGRLLVDLGRALWLKQVNTYSWHPGPRGPQVYTLYGSEGGSSEFNARPGRELQPEKCGWGLITKVDTRETHGMSGGQYGVSVSNTAGAIGKYRYLLFVILRTENQDDFGNTFYSEIDVIDRDAPEPPQPAAAPPPPPDLSRGFASGGGRYQITIDPSRAPDLADWAYKDLAPVAQEWYPRIVKLLPSEGFQPPDKLTIDFGNNTGGFVAITRGNRVTCNTAWFRENVGGEARGCVVHELVHVVQHYDQGDTAPRASVPPPPVWLAEGIPDYIRWFIYEPQAHGADVVWMRQQQNLSVRFDASYRVSANFLNWVTQKYNSNVVEQLNVTLRQGHYTDQLWGRLTGHEVDELGDEWKKWLSVEMGTPAKGGAEHNERGDAQGKAASH
jgi:hypothetical protein